MYKADVVTLTLNQRTLGSRPSAPTIFRLKTRHLRSAIYRHGVEGNPSTSTMLSPLLWLVSIHSLQCRANDT